MTNNESIAMSRMMNRKKTILVIDDDKNFSFGLISILQRAGYNVQAAGNGQEGLAAIRSLKPNLILCDIMMPPPNGIQLKKEISRESDLERIPFLFLTARTSQADKLAGLESGADDYITKPANSEELLARIHAALRRDQISHQHGVEDASTQSRKQFDENHEMKRQTLHQIDPLTGAMSRRGLEIIDPMNFRFLVLVDIDHFKEINNKYGRSFGDQVLTDFVHFFQLTANSSNMMIRWGSDEFLLLLDPLTKNKYDYQDIENILVRIQQQYFNTYPKIKITFAYGVAMMQASFDKTLEQVDYRMNEMKRYHKNPSI